MDELKKYLQQNAAELDRDEPHPRVWDQIRQEVQVAPKQNVVLMISRWAAAACVLALAGLGGWFLLKTQPSNDKIARRVTPAAVTVTPSQLPVLQPPAQEGQPLASNEQPVAERRTAPAGHNSTRSPQPAYALSGAELKQLNELESSFTQVINLQRARVDNTPMYAETPEYFSDFKVQMRQMEKDEKQIKADISRRGLNDELLDQLINLYQQKLNILKQLQLEMNKTNNRFKQNRGPVDSTKTYFLNI